MEDATPAVLPPDAATRTLAIAHPIILSGALPTAQPIVHPPVIQPSPLLCNAPLVLPGWHQGHPCQ